MTALVDSLSDDEEAGDVEAALRRLEGQINQDKQKAKISKVDNWVQSIRARLATGQLAGGLDLDADVGAEEDGEEGVGEGQGQGRYSSDEEDYGELQESRYMRDSGGSMGRSSLSWASSTSS